MDQALFLQELEFLMNNEMDDFSSKPGYPNAYGLIGSEANKIEPKKNSSFIYVSSNSFS